MSSLAHLAKAETVDKFERRLAKLEASDAWKNKKLAAYISDEWLPCRKQWAACYRVVYHGGINTNNHQESMNKVIKTMFLKNRGDQRLDSLLKMFFNEINPYYARKYRMAHLISVR